MLSNNRITLAEIERSQRERETQLIGIGGWLLFPKQKRLFVRRRRTPHSAYLDCHLKMAAVAAASSHRNTSYDMSGAANNLAIFNTHTQPAIYKCSLSLFRWISTFLFPPYLSFPTSFPSSHNMSRISWWNSTLLLNWFLKKKRRDFLSLLLVFYGVSRLVPCINFRTGLLRSTGPVNFVG